MFLRASKRLKDGKEHYYWSIAENKRVAGGKIVQRHVLYLGEPKRSVDGLPKAAPKGWSEATSNQ